MKGSPISSARAILYCGTPSKTCSRVCSSSLRSASEVAPPKRMFDASTAFFVLLLRVDHHGNLLRQPFLQDSQVRGCVVFGDQVVDGLFIEQREDLDVALGVLVAGVEPELVELVRRRITRVEPYVAALGLAELGAVGFGNQRAGEGESLAAGLAADQAPCRW